MKKVYLHPEMEIEEMMSHEELLAASLPVSDEEVKNSEDVLAPENDSWEF
jgi:hypothetical protein